MKVISSYEEFNQEVRNGVVLVDFYATWCGPCKMLAPILEEISDELADKISVVKVDVDEQEQLARDFNISSIPTLIVFKNGKPVSQSLGFQPKARIIEGLKKYL